MMTRKPVFMFALLMLMATSAFIYSACDSLCRMRHRWHVCGTQTYWYFERTDCFMCYKFPNIAKFGECSQDPDDEANTKCVKNGTVLRISYQGELDVCACGGANLLTVESAFYSVDEMFMTSVDRFICTVNPTITPIPTNTPAE